MYIPNTTYLEKGMSITYKDIKAAKEALDKKVFDREGELRGYILNLKNYYQESLFLDNYQWYDRSNRGHDYVQLGEMTLNGFVETPVVRLKMNKEREIHFAIATVIDDEPQNAGDAYIIEMAIHALEGDAFIRMVGHNKEIRVAMPKEKEAFHDVCAIMKQVIVNGLTDHRLD